MKRRTRPSQKSIGLNKPEVDLLIKGLELLNVSSENEIHLSLLRKLKLVEQSIKTTEYGAVGKLLTILAILSTLAYTNTARADATQEALPGPTVGGVSYQPVLKHTIGIKAGWAVGSFNSESQSLANGSVFVQSLRESGFVTGFQFSMYSSAGTTNRTSVFTPYIGYRFNDLLGVSPLYINLGAGPGVTNNAAGQSASVFSYYDIGTELIRKSAFYVGVGYSGASSQAAGNNSQNISNFYLSFGTNF
jgi:hypothetical protein